MIIFRYLAREVLSSMFAASSVLLLIIVSARFTNYLAQAAAGKLDAGVLLILMVYRSLSFMELILPLGLFIGIMLSYGRLYMQSEMTVLSACGLSNRRLLGYTMVTSLGVALLVAFLTMYLGPKGTKESQQVLFEQRNKTDFETILPARFNDLDSGRGVSFAQSISSDKQQLLGVFIAELSPDGDKGAPSILVANSGEIDAQLGQKFLLLRDGKRYLGRPGSANYEVVEFEEFYQKLPEPDYQIGRRKATDSMSTLALLENPSVESRAALQWRLSLPMLVMIVGFLAVPLSRTEPRRGRYGKLVPAIVIYIVYLVSLNSARGLLESGESPTEAILWLVHLAFFVLACILYLSPSWFSGGFRVFKIKRRASEAAS